MTRTKARAALNPAYSWRPNDKAVLYMKMRGMIDPRTMNVRETVNLNREMNEAWIHYCENVQRQSPDSLTPAELMEGWVKHQIRKRRTAIENLQNEIYLLANGGVQKYLTDEQISMAARSKEADPLTTEELLLVLENA